MNSLLTNHQATVTKALEFAQANLSTRLSLQSIGKEVGYSASRLKVIFKQVTGRGLISHITEMRIERAKRLLAQSRIPISEVAFDLGFNSHEQFCRIFRKKAGLSPSAYRNLALSDSIQHQTGTDSFSPQEWFSQDFHRPGIEKNWKITEGVFSRQPDYAVAEGRTSFYMLFEKNLPENFEAVLELKLLAGSGQTPSHFVFAIMGDDFAASSYKVVIGDYDHQLCHLRYQESIRKTKYNPPIRANQWQTLRVRLQDDLIRADLDDTRLFEYRNDFPLRYEKRNKILLATWNSSVHLRRISIADLGYPAVVPPVRQGDSLYNAGVYGAAREFYARLLGSDAATVDPMELYYKIGMCFLAEDALSEARAWLEKVTLPVESSFWARQARLSLAYMDLVEEKPGGDLHAEILCGDPALHDDMRTLIERIIRRLVPGGFFERCLALNRILRKHEKPGSPLQRSLEIDADELLFWSNRASEAEEFLGQIAGTPGLSVQTRYQVLFDLGFACLIQGKLDAAQKATDEARSVGRDAPMIENCSLRDGFILRARGQMDKALELLEKLWTQKQFDGISAFAKMEMSMIFCSLRRVEEAREALALAEARFPYQAASPHGGRSSYQYPPELLTENYEHASDLLWDDAKNGSTSLFLRAEKASFASMVWEIAGDRKRARQSWSEMIRRFPPAQCAFYSHMAQRMLEGDWTVLKELTSGAYNRSELFFLAGLMFETRGDSQHSREFLELCLKEDPSLRWPSYLAKKKL